jgi:intracellular sulfur oxidation DsrE/DsrF family protein
LAIPGLPVARDIPGAHELPDPKLDYKIIFDVQSETAGNKPEEVSPSLVMITALINTYEKYGVSPDHLHLWAVFHGRPILLVTDDVTYKARTGIDHNPNAALLQQLSKAGLHMAVCGQSTMAQHYDFKSILPIVQINLSASVTLINLETRGYIRVEV